jgi:ribonuclease BN (tRNA processing enzyme)
MQVTVLGKSPSWQDAAGACSGYLITHEGFTLLLDCGNGVFAKLRSHVDYCAVDAVLISHLHADHFFDVVPYSFALSYGLRQSPPRPALHAPPGATGQLATIGACLGDESLISNAFSVTEYDPARTLTLGPLQVSLCEVPHYVLTHAVQITAPGSGRFTFGADCRPNEALPRFASGSDLMIVEATLREPERFGTRGHLTAREAGEHGRSAGARRLVLTHFSDELDPLQIAAEGAAGFGGEVELAHEGAAFDV